MPAKRIEIHPAALAELKSAVEWYLERSEPASKEFVAEVDRAGLIVELGSVGRAGEDIDDNTLAVRIGCLDARGTRHSCESRWP